MRCVVLAVLSALLISGCANLAAEDSYRPEFDHRLKGYMHGNHDYPN